MKCKQNTRNDLAIHYREEKTEKEKHSRSEITLLSLRGDSD